MEIIKANNQKTDVSGWRFNQLDLNCLNMIIKEVWVFDCFIDEVQLKSSLAQLLDYYPQLAGRIKNKSEVLLNNAGVVFSVAQRNKSIQEIENDPKHLDAYNPGIDIRKLVNGEAPLLSLQITKFEDGSVLSIHCAHVCMDGNGFFKMVGNLAKLYNKEAIERPELIRSEKIFKAIPSKDEAQKLMQERGWKAVPLKALFQFLIQKVTGVQKVVSPPIHISEEFVTTLRSEMEKKGIKHIGNHALFSAIVVRLCDTLNNFNKTVMCSQVSVIDLRGRLDAFPEFYVGNAALNAPSREFDPKIQLMDIAAIVQESLAKYLSQPHFLEEHVQLNIAGSQYKLPFTPFDLQAMNARKPTCFYINNLMKFNMYEISFGNGSPVLILPNDLPDTIKIWPSAPANPGVNVYLRGYLGKRFNKIKDKNTWMENVLQEILSEVQKSQE